MEIYHIMNTTKELLIKIKDAAIHHAISADDIPIKDIKDAVLAEYSVIARDAAKHQDELLSLYNDIESIADNEVNLSIIIHFLDKMIVNAPTHVPTNIPKNLL